MIELKWIRDIARLRELEAENARLRRALREILFIGEQHTDSAIGRRITDFRKAIGVARAAIEGEEE